MVAFEERVNTFPSTETGGIVSALPVCTKYNKCATIRTRRRQLNRAVYDSVLDGSAE